MSKRKILLADDSVTIQKVVNLTFADEGIDVITVGDGNAAMEKFVEFVPDLVLVDVNMPGADGYKICEMIKQDAETKHIPVVLLVGSFEPFDEAEARRVGADDYLTKPFQSIRQLVAKVSALLDASSTAENKNAPRGETSFSTENSGAESRNAELQNPFQSSATAAENYEDAESVRGNQIFAGANAANHDEQRQFYGDASREIDEERIQTNQIGSLPIDETQKFSADFANFAPEENASPIAVEAGATGNSTAYETGENETDWAKTQPLSAEEMREINSISDRYAAVETRAESASDAANPQNFYGEKTDDEKSAANDAAFGKQSAADENSQTENLSDIGGAAISTAQKFSPSWNFDETDLLELPDAGKRAFDFDDETIEVRAAAPHQFQNTDDIEAPPPQYEEIQTSDAQETCVSSTPETIPQTIPQTISQPTPVNFTPEEIDEIAAKVVEQLSARMLAELAPQIADLIVREMARGKNGE